MKDQIDMSKLTTLLDMGDPAGAAAHARKSLKGDGTTPQRDYPRRLRKGPARC